MKKKVLLITLPCILVLFITCQKYDLKVATKITTVSVTPGTTTIYAIGNIFDLSSNSHSDYGFCYGKTANPTITNGFKSFGVAKIGEYSGVIEGIAVRQLYYVRAYCKDGDSYVYGETRTTSIGTVAIANISTSATTAINKTTATSGGNITNDGGSAITVSGVCWSTTINPTIALTTKTTNGTVSGSFTSNMTGLTTGTTYYVRAYATNSLGTAYGNEVSFTTYNVNAISDVDNNYYNIVTIGTQTWMKENLKTTKYRDGSAIPNITNSAAWITQTTGAYCWYNNDEAAYKTIYGALYNFYTVVDSHNLCPMGWHVPSENEWNTLITYLGGASIAGGKMKSTSLWNSPNTGANNSSGFNGLPSGLRFYGSGSFSNLGVSGDWYSSDDNNSSTGGDRGLRYDNSNIVVGHTFKLNGISIRCLKDN